eukprot:TRINITY_DN2710_c0_g1_i1.p1 TRINITY_DN2710_c0_g1~~TRINITY_DN2710_c0_g1_i1.p1  ORF type:complete len:299 (-),score=89.81 TRINITY_DN2710_c0_g1_i1:32-928(-)
MRRATRLLNTGKRATRRYAQQTLVRNYAGSSASDNSNNRQRLHGRVAVISGAAAGIGRESCLLFSREGAKIVATDVSEKGGQETVEMIKKNGGEAIFVKCDVSKDAEQKNVFDLAEKTYGKVNIVFNNAGVMLGEDDDENTSQAIWDKTFAINVYGVAIGCKYGIAAMKRAGGGSIINTASFVAKMGAATSQLAYTTSKAAVLGLTHELAAVHGLNNIRVNALCPGPLKTKLLMDFLDTEEKKQRRLVHIPMGRFGEAIEMAKVALFLASDDSSYVTGQEIYADGGITHTYVTPIKKN